MGDEVSYHDRILHDTGFATRPRADVQDACLQIASEADQQIADLQSKLLAQEAAVADVWNAEREELQKRLNYLAQWIGTEIRAIAGDTYAETPAEPGDAIFELREKIKGLQAKFAAEKLRAESAEAKLAEEKHHAEVYQASCGELAAQLSVAEAKLAAVREQYNNWMGEKQGYMQTLEAVAELAKEPTNDE